MNRPKILVLLAAHNGAKWIVQQIETILNQQRVDVRLVVSDDGSHDDTLAKVRQLAADPRVSIVAPPVPTGSAAQNFIWLIRNTRADGFDFVALADQDDIWHKDKLARASAALDLRGAAGYSCSVTAIWSTGRRKTQTQTRKSRRLDFMFEGAGQGCTFVLQAEFFRRIQDFFSCHAAHLQGLHYHDWAIYALSRSWALSWYFDAQPMVDYRQHEHNDTGTRFSRSGIVRRLRLIKSRWYARQMMMIARICAIAAPEDPKIADWASLVVKPVSVTRQLKIAGICLIEGRRRLLDRLVVLTAVLGGWV
jgi:rhamnosyltransferase